MFFRSRQLSVAVVGLICLSVGWSASACQGQQKYDPYHPKVKKICDKAVKYLKGLGNDGAVSLPQKTIASLAIVEYYKRHESRVPTDDPFVKKTVAELAGMVSGGSSEILLNNETYFPALVFILLAEYDAVEYRSQCIKVLKSLTDRQRKDGAFTYSAGKLSKAGDTSQSQFGALAFFVARQHKIPLDPERAKKLLQYFVGFQAQNGTWEYNTTSRGAGNVKGTNSIHSASLSSVYLLADMLRLSRRVKDVAGGKTNRELGLPKNVSVYVPPPEGTEGADNDAAWGLAGDGPVIPFEGGRLRSCKSGGNQWYANNFQFPAQMWNSYFVYALERYCFFKEQADGKLGPRLKSWYDDGVDYIQRNQKANGAIDSDNRVPNMPLAANTALYTLFMVRASEVISLPPVNTVMNGDSGLRSGNLSEAPDGTISSSDAERGLKSLIASLSDDKLEEEQLKTMTKALKRAVREFKQSDSQSRGNTSRFLKGLIKSDNFYRRLIAIRFLSGEQEMDYVPALIYATGDPDLRIAVPAHNGLRLTSRKFDTFKYVDQGNDDANLAQMQGLKRQWTKWFLELRPDAELFD